MLFEEIYTTFKKNRLNQLKKIFKTNIKHITKDLNKFFKIQKFK